MKDQLEQLDGEESETRIEFQRERRILKGRLAGLDRATTLELLTDFGLLPNYAFPERGVRFHGAVYNKHQRVDREYKPVELQCGAAAAIRELAPGVAFYNVPWHILTLIPFAPGLWSDRTNIDGVLWRITFRRETGITFCPWISVSGSSASWNRMRG